MIGEIATGLFCALVFFVLAQICSDVLGNFFDVDPNLVYFIAGGAYIDVNRKMRAYL